MPGMHITDRQVRRYMEHRRQGKTQVVAAAKAGFSERNASRCLLSCRADEAGSLVVGPDRIYLQRSG